MRKYLKTIYLVIVAMMLSILPLACTFETSGNGELDGMWRLQCVDTIASGRSSTFSDYQVYWSFQRDLVNIVKVEDVRNESYFMRFSRSDGKLMFSSPYIDDREKGDVPLDDVQTLAPFGINNLTETFKVENLNGSSMTLANDCLRLKFRKF